MKHNSQLQIPRTNDVINIIINIIRRNLHTEKTFQNLIKSNWNQIVFTIFQYIWDQTVVRFVPNQSENDIYNLNSVWLIMILKRFICVYSTMVNMLFIFYLNVYVLIKIDIVIYIYVPELNPLIVSFYENIKD